MEAYVKAEWDRLRAIALHRPGMEMFFGLLAPYASLYDRAFPQEAATGEHEHLGKVLHDHFGVTVLSLKDSIVSAATSDPEVRQRLVDSARKQIEFAGDAAEAGLEMLEFQKNSVAHDPGFFFDIILMNPEIGLSLGSGERDITLNITSRQPLSNLYFMRDQQVVTPNGVILGNLAKPQRARELLLTKMFWDCAKAHVAGEIKGPGTFEGGDFIPMKDFALVGTGDRTNALGIQQFLACSPGFDEIAVIFSPKHPLIPGNEPDPMVSMHLDTWFNVASSKTVIGSETLMKNAFVRIFYRDGGAYRQSPDSSDLHSYIRNKGFDIIDITTLEQMAYAPNFLCIRDGTILAVDVDRTVRDVLRTLNTKAQMDPARYGALYAQAAKDYSRLKNEGQFFPHKKEIYQEGIEVYPVDLRYLTGGYGAAHCISCPIRRS